MHINLILDLEVANLNGMNTMTGRTRVILDKTKLRGTSQRFSERVSDSGAATI